MTAKQYLDQIHRSDWMIKSKSAEIIQLNILATSITAATDNERVQSSGSKDRMGDAVTKIADAKKELVELAYKHLRIKHTIISQIDALQGRTEYVQVLHMRYVQYLNFSDIADDMNYTLRQIMNLHKEAINCFEEQFGCEFENIS